MSTGSTDCSCRQGQPLSWLTLELFGLGDLPEAEHRRVERHLEDCPCCQSCLQSIKADEERELPPLPTGHPSCDTDGFARRIDSVRPRRPVWWRSRSTRLALASAVAAAAAVVLLVLLWPVPPSPSRSVPPARIAGYKGGELALALVRERRGTIQPDPTRFAPTDRFKALATCPPGESLHGEVVVYHEGGAAFPLSTVSPLVCGNRQPVQGAFSLSGESSVLVCLVVGRRPPPRDVLARVGPEQLSGRGLEVVCLQLHPAGR